MSSIRDKVAARKPGATRVEIPEWDVTVEIRPISVKARRGLIVGDEDPTALSLRLLVAAVYDPETGEPAFTDDDVPMLADQEAGLIDRLLADVMAASGSTREAVEAGKGIS